MAAFAAKRKERRAGVTPLIAPHYALGRSSPLPIPSCGMRIVSLAIQQCQLYSTGMDRTGLGFRNRGPLTGCMSVKNRASSNLSDMEKRTMSNDSPLPVCYKSMQVCFYYAPVFFLSIRP